MLQTLRNHKKKLYFGGIVGAAIGGYYAYQKVRPIVDMIREQMKMMKTLEQSSAEQEKQSICTQLDHNLRVGQVTLKNFSKKMKKQIKERFDVDGLRATMSKAKGKRTDEDYKQWEQFKLWGFSRTLAAMYAASLLNLLIKVQLSIVSRYVLTDSNQTQSNKAAAEIINKKFLSFSSYAQGEGLERLCGDVYTLVEGALAEWPLDRDCTLKDVQNLLGGIKTSFQSRSLLYLFITSFEYRSFLCLCITSFALNIVLFFIYLF